MAANKSAEALINSERAWVIAELIPQVVIRSFLVAQNAHDLIWCGRGGSVLGQGSSVSHVVAGNWAQAEPLGL
jgi:hypothetical protein